MKTLFNINYSVLLIVMVISIFLSGCTEKTSSTVNTDIVPKDEVELPLLELNLRFHIMQDIIIPHPSGINLDRWVSPDDITNTILPEMNAIYDQAKIEWIIDTIILEDVVKDSNYDQSINYLATCVRDSEGHSDPARLPLLYSLMQPQNRSQAEEIGKNLFHIYIFPFVGNTSQGNAMKGFDCHTIVGSWTNKPSRGGTPEKFILTENHAYYDKGSLSRTCAHELGHVLTLRHDECPQDCLMSGGSNGYSLTSTQIAEARVEALIRSL